MSNVKIIGVSGKIGAGKDEVCKIIQKLTAKPSDLMDNVFDTGPESEWKVKKFAGILKQMVSLLIGCSLSQLEDQEFKNKPLGEEWAKYGIGGKIELTPRLIMQLLGTECMRDIIHPNSHVNALFANVKENDKILISDTRFPNEADKIKEKKGVVIRINRPSIKRSAEEHFSETALDNYKNFDYLINNDGTLEKLENEVRWILKDLNII